MELRPRKGRSVQPPSTPTVAKPSPRPPAQSSSRRKPAPVPSTPIQVSEDEDEDPEAICLDPVDAAPKEVHADKVTATSEEKSDKSALKQGNQDINFPDSSEFETPLSSIARLRRAQIKVASSKNAKSKTKATSSIKKKMAEKLGSTPVADTHIASNRIAATSGKVRLDKAMTKKLSGTPNGVVASKESEKPEALTKSARQNTDEIAVEITLSAQEVCLKKTEVLSPSLDGKEVHSSTMKSVKKRDENNEVVDAKVDRSGHPKHIADVIAPVISEPQALSLILSDDETVQVFDAVQADGCEEKISASKEAAIEKCSSGAGVSKTSRSSKKSQSNKKVIIEEESLSRKLFEETCDDDQKRHELGSIVNSSKKGVSQIDSVAAENSAERVVSTSIRHSFKSPSASVKGREVADIEMLDVDGDKLNASDTGNKGEDIANDGVQEVSEESSDEAAFSGDERDGDINSDHAKLDAAIACSPKKAVHDEECSSSNDDDGNASTDSDDGDDEDEMASIFFSSLKAHLHKKAEPSGSGMQKDEQAKQDALIRLESQLTKSVVKKPCANGGLTGHGLSWSPEIMLSASKTSKAQVGKSRSIVEASPDTIWAKDRCLQDGLCVPPVDPLKLNKLARKQKGDTAGAKWFNLSAPTITPEIKKELQLVKLRGALDPKRHYKADDSKGLPKFFQVGTVIGGPADFYSGRLTKKEQKSSLASELLSDSSLTTYRKRKFLEIQDQKQAGGKGFWKKKKSKRTPAWAKI